MKRIFLFWVSLIFFGIPDLYAQMTTSYLKIGDTIPDMTLHLIHYPKKEIKISEFKGKLLILDFWNVWCGSCIKAMPEMEKLQNHFKDKIQIILVTSDDFGKVVNAAKSIKNIKDSKLPMIVGDDKLRVFLPIATVPTHVWIDGDRVVRQITNGYNTTQNTIDFFLKGGKTNLPVKIEWKNFDRMAPFLGLHDDRLIKLVDSYSIFLKNIPNFGGGNAGILRDTTDNSIIGVHAVNCSLLQLYTIAFTKGFLEFNPLEFKSAAFKFRNRYIIQVKNPRPFEFPKDHTDIDNWIVENTYSYEIKVSKEQSRYFPLFMQQDLDRHFNLTSKLIKKRLPVYILKRTTEEKKIRPLNRSFLLVPNEEDADGSTHNLIGDWKTLSSVITGSLTKAEQPIILDETGFLPKEKVGVELHAPLNNIHSLGKQLARYGLKLVKEYRVIDLVQIVDAENPYIN